MLYFPAVSENRMRFALTKKHLNPRGSGLPAVVNGLFYLFSLIYPELLLQFIAFDRPGSDFFYIIGFSPVYACALALVILVLLQLSQ